MTTRNQDSTQGKSAQDAVDLQMAMTIVAFAGPSLARAFWNVLPEERLQEPAPVPHQGGEQSFF